jgi:ribosomal protein S18 acetylase RimI-like enzyme
MITMQDIRYVSDPTKVTVDHLQGFFVGWPNPPSPSVHYRMLLGSTHVELAVDAETEAVVGYVSVMSDGVLFAYVASLEVLPAYQGRGIGSELIRRMLARLRELYAIDLLCDPEVQPFYGRLGMRPATGMMVRNYDRQSGAAT